MNLILTACSLYFFKFLFVLATDYDTFPHIEIYGNKFFNSKTQEQYFMKGIAYQPKFSSSQDALDSESNSEEISIAEYIDPLSDPKICLRDIPYLVKLGVNTIRVYAINPIKSHDVCMEELMKNNIYVVIDLSEPKTSIVRNDPHWDNVLWQRYKDVIDCMIKYPNLLGVFAGNEVTNDITNTDASPFVKAAIRDLKNYLVEKNYRKIPVGYSTNDDVSTRDNLAKYFICGDVNADFYGINMYEWCGYSSFETSGYKERTEEFKNYPIPVIFSEFGCNLVRPRPFTEIKELYGKEMAKVWSGGIVYMYFEEENEYGVVEINEQGKVVELDDFANLKKAYTEIKVIGISKKDAKADQNLAKLNKNIHCPTLNYSWKANEKLPPTPNRERCECLNAGQNSDENLLPCSIEPFEDDEKYEKFFNYICNKIDCSDIITDGKDGNYGNFSDCNMIQKLNLQLSKMYWSQKGKSDKCPVIDRNIVFNTKYKGRLNKNVKEGKAKSNSCFDIISEIKASMEETTDSKKKSHDTNSVPITESNSKVDKNKDQEPSNKNSKQNNEGKSKRINSGNFFAILFVMMSTFLFD